MPSLGQFKLSEIEAMLARCSPGARIVRKEHRIRVLDAKGGMYRGLPSGAHGKKDKDPEIEFGHIRKMARHLGFEECCVEYFGFQKKTK